jgi:hypothetical protein
LCIRTLDLGFVALRLPHQQRRGLAVERISRIRVAQELWQKHLENVDHVVHWRPRLIDDVEADGAGELVDVGVEDAVYEADARALVGVLVWELDVDFPEAAFEGGWRGVSGVWDWLGYLLTYFLRDP